MKVTVVFLVLPNIPVNARWSKNGNTVIDGLNQPRGLSINQQTGTVFVADHIKHRIVAWTPGENSEGRVVAGGKGQGKGLNQLDRPTDVLFDGSTNSIIISDDDRVMRWSLEEGTKKGEKIIGGIYCKGLTIDKDGALYITDWLRHEVKRYPRGDTTGIVVAGGNGEGNALNQFKWPYYIAVDDEGSIYVSDNDNHRVMKWSNGKPEIVAGDGTKGDSSSQLNRPEGILIDDSGTLYVADRDNHRVTRWRRGEKTGEIIVGTGESGRQAHQLNQPIGLSFDRHGNLYVADRDNNRVQRFDIQQ